MFSCIQIALLLGHIHVKLYSTVFHIKEIIEEYLRLNRQGTDATIYLLLQMDFILWEEY